MALIQAILPAARKRLVTIEDGMPLVEAAKLLSTADTNLLVVCNVKGLMSGVVTKSDVVQQISHCQGCSCRTLVTDVMTRNVIACHPEQDLHDVWILMKDNRLKQIPISNDIHEPLGLLYANEALEALMKEVEYEDLLLRDYVMGIGYR